MSVIEVYSVCMCSNKRVHVDKKDMIELFYTHWEGNNGKKGY